LFVTLVTVGPPGAPPVAPYVRYWKLIDEALIAVISILAALPPFVATPKIVFTESEDVGIGLAVASAAKLCKIVWLTEAYPLAPERPSRAKDPPLALPTNVRLVPL
jgi:hypothetical protein